MTTEKIKRQRLEEAGSLFSTEHPLFVTAPEPLPGIEIKDEVEELDTPTESLRFVQLEHSFPPSPSPTIETPEAKLERENAYDLPLDRILQLIRFDPKRPPNENGIAIIKAMARAWHIPLGCMSWISTKMGGAPYITFEGILYRIHHDPRGVSAITTEIVEMPKKENEMTVVIKGFVQMGDNKVFSAFGSVSQVERPDLGTGGRLLLADTKACRRSCMRAVGVPFPVYEDMIEYEKEQSVQTTYAARGGSSSSRPITIIEKPKDMDSVGALLAEALGRGMKMNDLLAKLGVEEIKDIQDVGAARKELFGE